MIEHRLLHIGGGDRESATFAILRDGYHGHHTIGRYDSTCDSHESGKLAKVEDMGVAEADGEVR